MKRRERPGLVAAKRGAIEQQRGFHDPVPAEQYDTPEEAPNHSSTMRAPGQAPRMIVCFLCGTSHGIASLLIHQKQCAMKWEKAQAGLEPSARTKRPLPPEMPPPRPSAGMSEVDAFNAAAQEAYNKNMPECSACGRTFATSEKVATHAKSCKGTKPKSVSKTGLLPASPSSFFANWLVPLIKMCHCLSLIKKCHYIPLIRTCHYSI